MCDYETFILVNNHQIATWWKRYLIFLILGKSMNDIVLDKLFNLWPVILQISLICVWKVNLWSILTSHNFKHLLFPNFSFEILWLLVSFALHSRWHLFGLAFISLQPNHWKSFYDAVSRYVETSFISLRNLYGVLSLM